jgi:hypothetical protein
MDSKFLGHLVGRRIESGWDFGDTEMARLIRIVETV